MTTPTTIPSRTEQHRALPALALCLLALGACSSKRDPPPPPPPPEVSVVKTVATTVPVVDEYVGQTEAVDTVEIRSRVGGILERQVFQDGARVKKGALLFVIDQQPYITALAQARAARAQARASYVNSKQNLDRIRPLLADQAISQQDLDAAVAKERADAANVEAAQAQVKQAELNLGYTTITAPRDGIMSKALIKPGGLVNASTTLLTTLYSIDPIHVNFVISEQRMVDLQKHLRPNTGERKDKAPPFKLKLVDGSEYKFSGKLDFVDAAVDPKSGTLQVRLSVPNPDRFLRPGQFVRVLVAGQENPNAIRVPQQAVQEMQGKRSVFVVGADNKVVYREIVAKSRAGNDWVVEGGLKPGELVVVEGTQKVKPGAAVKPLLLAQDGGGAKPTADEKKPPEAAKAGG
jgi:membrane fusion protein, multidrug efflux system